MPKYIIKKLFEGILIAIVIISVDRLFEHFENKSTSEMTAKYSDIGELVETIDFSYDPVDQFWPKAYSSVNMVMSFVRDKFLHLLRHGWLQTSSI